MNAAAHIDRLLRLFPSTRRVSQGTRSDSLQAIFEVVFEAGSGLHTLRLYLPADFPMAAPAMQVVGGLAHPWLDPYGRVVGCVSLNSWSPSTSLLDAVAQDVLVGLQIGITTSDLSPPSYEETVLAASGAQGPSAVPLRPADQVRWLFILIVL